MSISTVVSRGYGSFGKVNFVPTRGYTPGAARTTVIDTHDAYIRRQKDHERREKSLQAQRQEKLANAVLLRQQIEEARSLPVVVHEQISELPVAKQPAIGPVINEVLPTFEYQLQLINEEIKLLEQQLQIQSLRRAKQREDDDITAILMLIW